MMLCKCVLLAILLSCCCEACLLRKDGTCCKTKKCSTGEGYNFCNGTQEHPGEDTCFPCPSGTHNRDSINTGEMPTVWRVCVPLDCSCESDGNVIVNKEACLRGEEKICVCDRKQFFFGSDPMICEKVRDPMIIESVKRPGQELTNTGRNKSCEEGHFKSTADASICKPHTKCGAGYQIKYPGNTTSDVVCEEIPGRETTQKIPPHGDKNDISHPHNKNETREPDPPVEEESWYTGLIGIAAVGLVVLVIIAVVCVMVWKYPDKCRCFSPLIKNLKLRCGIQTHPPADEESPAMNENREEPVYEEIDREQTNLLKAVEPEVEPDALSDLGQGGSFGSSSDVPTYVRSGEISDLPTLPSTATSSGDPGCRDCHHSDTDSETCGTSLRTDPNLGKRNEAKPVGIVPNQRVENEGQPVYSSENGPGLLAPTGWRVTDPAPRIYSGHHQV
ncbi:tumor necrosis factor receptor superfamily member 1B-like isoform X2 [Ostrea edulis]|uniref:tumor necrosis factor receptor superfamily member 1B-like isoform X2 n=1 Tax=Ostrea edulis TaxID=37623 RepID=UPI0024AE8F88|nr:tumor necrosis factor receptor superfamily member 1B-like isoform X2 [Ostrea edulis]